MKRIFILLLWLLCSPGLFAQTIYYVKTSGSDANNGTSWATAFRTVQKALATAGSGQQIWVAAGTYYPDEGTGQTNDNRNATFALRANLAVYGGFAGTETALHQRDLKIRVTTLSGDLQKNDQRPFINYGDNAYHVVTASGITGALLDGFTITGGNAGDPGGAGIRSYNATFTLANCRLIENTSYRSGGGIYIEIGSLTVINCSFIANRSTDYSGGAVLISGYADERNVWWANATFTNCSFVSNSAHSYGGGISISWYARTYITNSIFWGNSSGLTAAGNAQIGYGVYDIPPQVTYSIVQGGWGGTGNLGADPLFANPATGDYRLQFCSPAIDAGNTAVVTEPTDLIGLPRINGPQVDMGAYESQESRVIYVKAGATGLKNGTSWINAFTSLQDALAKWPGCPIPFQIWVAAGTYYPDITGSANSNLPTASFQLRNKVTLLGGFPATGSPGIADRDWVSNTTTLSGEIQQDGDHNNNAYHVVSSASLNTTAVLDGFTITGGNAGAPGNNKGGGLYNVSSSPTVSNCSFEGNSAVEGGALYNNAASPTLTHCRFLWNRANYGGAIYNYNNAPVLTRCRFDGNTAANDGGGIYNYASSSTLINCSFSGNVATAGAGLNNFYSSNVRLTNCSFGANTSGDGGGLFNWVSSPTLTNCILWGNTPNQLNGEATITWSIVQDGYSGTGNLAADPKFVAAGDLHLQSGSPAIDAGNSAAVTEATDLDGTPRIKGAQVDMGAYEYGAIAGDPPHPPGPYTPLTLTCPEDFTVNTQEGSCGAMVDYFDSHPGLVMGGKRPVTVTYSPASPSFLPTGIHTITVSATDSTGETKTCSFTVTVVDATAPVISNVSATPSVLYPPNHKLQDVTVNYEVSDCSEVVTTLSVSSNEPVYTAGSGDTGPDWEIIDNHKVKLRAERSGKGSDRVYTITITATDATGNESTATTTVTVPHDKGAPVTRSEAAIGKEVPRLEVRAVPNPSSEGFTLYTQSPSMLPLTIRVLDGAGRGIEQRAGVAPNGALYLGSTYRPGAYYIEVVQGRVVQTLKLVKKVQ